MAPPVLAVLEFAAPIAAWGALAAAVPVLIHMVLRPRTRRQVLPTLRFLLVAVQSANRTHRLKRFLLLACRVALILLLVLLLMRPGYRPAAAASHGPARSPGLPVSAVFAFDNSASMSYRYQGQTRLAWAIGHARTLLEDPARFPEGSQVALVTGPPHVLPATWMEPPSAPRHLNRLSPEDHDVTAVRLLEQSYAMLRGARHATREVYLFTDLARHAWAGAMPTAPAEFSGLYILDVGQSDSPNLGLGWPRAANPQVPASRPSELTIALTASQLRAQGHQLAIDVDGQRRGAQTLPALEPGERRDVTVQVPPLDPGNHRIALRLEPEDALPVDNRRFAALAAGDTPCVLLVGDESASAVPRLLRAMIAPPAQPSRYHRFALEIASPSAWEARLDARPFMIILADVPTVTGPQWQGAEAFVRAGGSLLVVPGSHVTAAGYAGGALLPAAVLGITSLDPPTALAAAELNHPFLRPFASQDVDSINAPHAWRRLRTGPLRPGGATVIPFADAEPGLIERSLGAGRVLLMTFSPDPEWGQFGTQAAPFLVLIQTLLGELAPRPGGLGSFAAGQAVSFPLSEPVTELYQLGGPAPVTIPVQSGRAALPTGRAGVYQLCPDGGCTEALLTYSVNVREVESDLARIAETELLDRLPKGRTRIVPDALTLQKGEAGPAYGSDLLVPVALGLLGLMFVESLFANRFYSTRAGSGTAAGPTSGHRPEPRV